MRFPSHFCHNLLRIIMVDINKNTPRKNRDFVQSFHVIP